MTTPRIRRLQNEYHSMRELAECSSLISFSSRGVPPTRYEVTLTCDGLLQADHQIYKTSPHRFIITLDDSFPITAPIVIWQTQIFHPNIKPPHVCSGNIWYPAFSLADLCVALCELVQYKQFNIYDPLDLDAATWLYVQLREAPETIPVDRRPVVDQDFDIEARPHQVED